MKLQSLAIIFIIIIMPISMVLSEYISNKIGNVSKIVGGLILIALSIQNLTK